LRPLSERRTKGLISNRDEPQVEEGPTVKLRVDKSSRLKELMDEYQRHQNCALILEYKSSSAPRFTREQTSLLGKGLCRY
jgi:hypothetical protein